MIADLDRYVWELACKQLKEWKEKGREQMYISVNISPKDFYFMNIYDVMTTTHGWSFGVTENGISQAHVSRL